MLETISKQTNTGETQLKERKKGTTADVLPNMAAGAAAHP
jgi:hypothetical protein